MPAPTIPFYEYAFALALLLGTAALAEAEGQPDSGADLQYWAEKVLTAERPAPSFMVGRMLALAQELAGGEV